MGAKVVKPVRKHKRRVSRRHEVGWAVYEIDMNGPSRGIDIFEGWNEYAVRSRAAFLNRLSDHFYYQVRMFKNT